MDFPIHSHGGDVIDRYNCTLGALGISLVDGSVLSGDGRPSETINQSRGRNHGQRKRSLLDDFLA